MDQADFQQTHSVPVPLFGEINDSIGQNGDDQQGLYLTSTGPCGYDWDVGCIHIPTNVTGQNLPLNPAPHAGSIPQWYSNRAALLNSGRSVCDDTSLNAAERQFPVNGQSYVHNLLLKPQTATTEIQSGSYSDVNCQSLSGYQHAQIADAALTTRRLEEPIPPTQQRSPRCVRCWALRKPVSLLIQMYVDY